MVSNLARHSHLRGRISLSLSVFTHCAIRGIYENVTPADVGKTYTVNVLTEYKPCPDRCTPAIRSGVWQIELQGIADDVSGGGVNIRLRVWQVLDNGWLRLYTGSK
jgi:hypothetical protein